MTALDQINVLLQQLDKPQLTQVKARINVLLSLGGAPPVQDSTKDSTDYTEEELVLRTICSTLQRMNGSPVTRLELGRASPLRKHLPGLLEYLQNIDERNRAAFLDVAIQMLAENIREQGIPLTPGVMIRQLHRLPAVVDVAFPGYHQAGLLNLVIRAYEGGHHERS